MLVALNEKLRYARMQVDELGPGAALRYKWERLKGRLGRHRAPYALKSKQAAAPVWVRPNSSDLYVFDQIFIEREYRCLDHVGEASLIIDCGANVGYSSAYLLSRYPKSRLIAVEPESGNFEMLRRNTDPYKARVELLHAGIWSRSAGLVVEQPQARGGKEWAFTVREARADEKPDIEATDLTTVWRNAGSPEISILKVDIEGSEDVVFSALEKPWLDSVRNLVVELHNDRCSKALFAAIDGKGFVVSTYGELTVCTR